MFLVYVICACLHAVIILGLFVYRVHLGDRWIGRRQVGAREIVFSIFALGLGAGVMASVSILLYQQTKYAVRAARTLPPMLVG